MSIDLDETARILIHRTSESSYLRAIRLFEFQTYLLYPTAFSAEKETDVQISARLLATLKFLEHLEGKMLAASKKETIAWSDLSKNRDYVQIFEKIFLRSGGWRAIRYIWDAKEFDEQLRLRQREARAAAKIVDFSYRFAMLKPNDRRKAGVNMARSIVCTGYRYRKGLSTLKSRWREYGKTAAFSYLILEQKFELKPPSVRSKNFSDILLSQVDDIDHLTEFFLAYRHLCEVLHSRGYRFPPVHSVEGTLVSPLVVDKLPEDVEKAIQNYKSA
jgi:hypothetical protein